MKYYGHAQVKLMNGGRAKWDPEGKPLTADAVSHAAKSYIAKAANEDIRAYRDQVLSKVNTGSISLVDVRALAEYAGEFLAPENLPESSLGRRPAWRTHPQLGQCSLGTGCVGRGWHFQVGR